MVSGLRLHILAAPLADLIDLLVTLPLRQNLSQFVRPNSSAPESLRDCIGLYLHINLNAHSGQH